MDMSLCHQVEHSVYWKIQNNPHQNVQTIKNHFLNSDYFSFGVYIESSSVKK